MIVLLVSVVLISWGGILGDFETNYVDTGISEAEPVNSSFKEDYSGRAAEINATFAPLVADINEVGSSDGWIDTLGDGSTVIAKVFLSLPVLLLSTLRSATSDMSTMLTNIGIPNELVLVAMVLLLLFGVFKVIEMIRRYNA